MISRIHAARWAVALGLLGAAGAARAGGGPEGVIVVVNSASWASQTVANHFIQLRRIPPVNVVYIDWTGGFATVDAATFRGKILAPVLDAVEKRGIWAQTDYIVYSSDFPYAVDLTADFPQVKFPETAQPVCSLNSATYLWNLVMARLPLIMDLHINFYKRNPPPGNSALSTHGFRGWYGWGPQGELQEAGGQPYMLSTMLAITSGRGNSVSEAIAYLTRSAAADGSQPKGTVYFSKTDDKRSTVRTPDFPAAVEDLKQLGVKARIITDAVPTNRSDVIGAMLGAPTFSWAASRSKILPGAICENFTSFGGIMVEEAGQTPLTELLRFGAAGASGTVVEPYRIPEKFPSPQIHVHYARGCTLAEAYYQSVHAPAQFLIVGDPLCRPWAQIPSIQAGAAAPLAKVSGDVTFKPQGSLDNGGKVDRFELFVDGRRAAATFSGGELRWNSRDEGDGYHELRVVGIEDSPIETQGREIIPVLVDNHGRSVQATVAANVARWDRTLVVTARSAGASQLLLVHNNRILARATGEQGELKLNPRVLGTGPVALQVVAVPASGPRSYTFAAPLELTIEAAPPLGPIKDAPARLVEGLALTLADGTIARIQETRNPNWMAVAGVKPNDTFSVEAYFDVKTDDVYQFQLWHDGELKLGVDGAALYAGTKGDYTQKFVPVALAKGKHRLLFSGKAAGDVRLRILFGGPGAISLSGTMFRHPPQ